MTVGQFLFDSTASTALTMPGWQSIGKTDD
jgi:hypothetical protein